MKIETVLKRLLHERKITVAELSRETCIARQTLDNWLSGQEPRSFDKVKAVADYFRVSLDELCFGISDNPHIKDYTDEINAGVFEVVLRRIKK